MYVRANNFVTTRMHRLNLITHGALLRTLRVRELHYIQELPVKGVCLFEKDQVTRNAFLCINIPQDNKS